MTGRSAPTVALVSVTVAVAAAATLAGDVAVADLATLSPFVTSGVFAVGAFVSWRRWSASSPRPATLNLALTFIAALALILDRAGRSASGTSGTASSLHAVAEVFLAVLAIRAFALTDASRVRAALLMSMGAVVAAGASGSIADSLPEVAVWTVAAVVAMLALLEVDRATLPGLTGATRPHGQVGARIGAAAAVLVATVAAAAAVAVVDPYPGRTAPAAGASAGAPLGPYDSFNRTLDTAARFTPGNEVVMTVDAPAPDFWRGQSFDRWDGRTWTSTQANTRFPVSGSGYVQGGVGDVDAGGEVFVQRFTVKSPAMQILFGAYRMDQVDTPVTGLVAHGDGSIELPEPLGAGASYTVVSQRLPVTATTLRRHDPVEGVIPPFVADLYLQLPGEPSRVTDLAHRVTDAAPTAYDKVQAIERWLGAHVRYTLDIPSLPDGADTVDQFLFVDRKGFCEQIASSTAVMLRTVGVPARVATGYVPGESSLLGGEFTVHASDAHAWVEVWFPGLGWQAFDPTASVPLAGDSKSSPVERLADFIGRAAPWFVVAAAIAFAAALVGIAVALIRRRRALAAAPWAHRFALRLERAGAARGRPRQAWETPLEYTSALAARELPDERLEAVGAVISTAAYGDGADDEKQQWAETVLREAERASPRKRRYRR